MNFLKEKNIFRTLVDFKLFSFFTLFFLAANINFAARASNVSIPLNFGTAPIDSVTYTYFRIGICTNHVAIANPIPLIPPAEPAPFGGSSPDFSLNSNAYCNIDLWSDGEVEDYDVTLTCQTITSPSAAQSICAGSTGTNIQVNTSTNTANAIKFVKFTTKQIAGSTPTAAEATAIYAGTAISTVTPTGSGSPYTATYTFATGDFPNTISSPVTYYVYAILNPDPGSSCEPVQEIKVTVNPTPTVTQPANQTLIAGINTTAVTFAGSVKINKHNLTKIYFVAINF